MARERFGDRLPSVDDLLAHKREEVALEQRKLRRLAGEEATASDEVA